MPVPETIDTLTETVIYDLLRAVGSGFISLTLVWQIANDYKSGISEWRGGQRIVRAENVWAFNICLCFAACGAVAFAIGFAVEVLGVIRLLISN